MKKLLFLFLFLFLSFGGVSANADVNDTVFYYSFDDVDLNGSNPKMLPVNEYQGSNVGAITGVSGIIGEAFDFVPIDYVSVGNIGSGNDFSVSIWVNVDSYISNPIALAKDTISNRDWYLQILDGGNVRMRIEDKSIKTTDTSTTPISLNTWHHIGVSVNSNYVVIYVDGNLELNLSNSGSLSWTSAPIVIGILSDLTNNAFDGSIDELGYYNRYLTKSDFEILYNGGAGLNPFSPVPSGGFTHNITGGYLTPNSSVYTDASNLRGNIFVNNTADVYVNYSYLVNDVEVVTGLYTGSPVGDSFILPVLSNTNFEQEDVVNFTAVLVNQSNTSLEVSPVFSSNGVTIINRVPTGDIEWSTRTPLNDSNFSAFVTPGDSDLDEINISWDLFKNGVLDSSGTELNVAHPYGTIELFVIDASTTIPGDNYTFNVSIHDGFDTYVSGQSLVATVTDSTNFTITVNDEWSGLGASPFYYYFNNLTIPSSANFNFFFNNSFVPDVNVSYSWPSNGSGFLSDLGFINVTETYGFSGLSAYSVYNHTSGSNVLLDYSGGSLGDNVVFYINGQPAILFNETVVSPGIGLIKYKSYLINNTKYSSESSITTSIVSNKTANITILIDGYFPITYTNWNLSENLFAELNQSRISFVAKAITSNTTINNVSFTISDITREVFPLSVGSYTVVASNTNWSGSKSFSVSALDIKTEIVPVSDTTLILGVSNHLTGNFKSGTKTGWYYNALHEKNYSFSFDSDTTNISLEKGLTYEFYLDVPPGFATNAGVAFNYTPSSNVANRNFTLFEPKTLEVFLFNTDAEVLTNETTIRVENTAVAYQTTTTAGSHYFDDILVGNYTVTITSNGFNTAYRFVSIGSNDYTAINVYLSRGGKTVSFNVIDNLGNPVDQAIIGLSYFVNGTQVFIGQRLTDLSGSAQMIVNENITYIVTANKNNYKTFSGSLTPFQTNYIINLDSDALNSFESVFTDVSYRTGFISQNNQSWALATFDVVSASGSIASLSMSATYRNTNYFVNSVNNPNGANLFLNITNINRSEENEITVTYQINSNNGEIISWNKTYLVQGMYDEENLLSIDLKTLPAGLKVFISAVIIALIAILSTVLSGRMIGGAIGGILGVAITIVLNLLTLIPGLLTIGVLFVLIITDIRTGENR